MALEITRRDEAAPYVATERLCLDEAREKVVPCESEAARWLLAGEGAEVSAEDAARYGLKQRGPAASIEKADADTPPEAPEAPARTKAVKPAEDKAAEVVGAPAEDQDAEARGSFPQDREAARQMETRPGRRKK